MEKFKYVVVLLVYQNVADLIECIESIQRKIRFCKIIVVNAFYDEESYNLIKKAAKENNCDFINVENKGYSYGNNSGIQFAKEHYIFEYVIISNPDIIVKKFDDSHISGFDAIAPKIITASGKHQNPMIVRENRIAEYFIYWGFKKKKKLLLFAGIGINKVIRTCYQWIMPLMNKNSYPIYAAHGSFVILSKKVLDKLKSVYDEMQFMFAEESVLAHKMKSNGLCTFYTNEIEVLHKEDGSIKLSNFSVNDEMAKANIYYYEHYRQN